MSSRPQPVDLTQVPAVPWAWVDEHVYAAIRGCSVKVLQNERRLNIGCPFRRINGTTIRYKLGDITAFLESQPGAAALQIPLIQPGGDVADRPGHRLDCFSTPGHEWSPDRVRGHERFQERQALSLRVQAGRAPASGFHRHREQATRHQRGAPSTGAIREEATAKFSKRKPANSSGKRFSTRPMNSSRITDPSTSRRPTPSMLSDM